MSAYLSECGKHRFWLQREVPEDMWALGRVTRSFPSFVTFIGVNPSTADQSIDDPTIRKMRGFAARWGFHHFNVLNLFTWRATDVKELAKHAPAELNTLHGLVALIDGISPASTDMLVPCWGNLQKVPRQLRPRAKEVRQLVLASGVPAFQLGKTSGGDPCHPVMLAYDTPLEPFV